MIAGRVPTSSSSSCSPTGFATSMSTVAAGDVHAAVNRLLSLLPRFTASYVTWLAQCGVPLS